MDVFFWAIDPRVAFWTRFEANFRLGGNQGPLFLNGLTSPRVPGQLPTVASWLLIPQPGWQKRSSRKLRESTSLPPAEKPYGRRMKASIDLLPSIRLQCPLD